jgi:hypothetical protein
MPRKVGACDASLSRPECHGGATPAGRVPKAHAPPAFQLWSNRSPYEGREARSIHRFGVEILRFDSLLTLYGICGKGSMTARLEQPIAAHRTSPYQAPTPNGHSIP